MIFLGVKNEVSRNSDVELTKRVSGYNKKEKKENKIFLPES